MNLQCCVFVNVSVLQIERKWWILLMIIYLKCHSNSWLCCWRILMCYKCCFGFEKRRASDSGNVDSLMRFCRWATYRRVSADEHRFILKPTPHPHPHPTTATFAFTITAFQFRKTKAWSVGGEARKMWAGSSYQRRPPIGRSVYSSGQEIYTNYLLEKPLKSLGFVI